MSMISSFSISREDIFSIKIIILVFRVYIEVSLIYSDDFFFVSEFEKPKAINIKSKFDRLHIHGQHIRQPEYQQI